MAIRGIGDENTETIETNRHLHYTILCLSRRYLFSHRQMWCCAMLTM